MLLKRKYIFSEIIFIRELGKSRGMCKKRCPAYSYNCDTGLLGCKDLKCNFFGHVMSVYIVCDYLNSRPESKYIYVAEKTN